MYATGCTPLCVKVCSGHPQLTFPYVLNPHPLLLLHRLHLQRHHLHTPHSPYELQRLRQVRIHTNPFGSVPIMSRQHHSVNAANRDTSSSFRSPTPEASVSPLGNSPEGEAQLEPLHDLLPLLPPE